jgi:hypothetical protein
MAARAEPKTSSSASRIHWPTGQSPLGARRGMANDSSHSTARNTSARSILSGARLKREPNPGPFLVSTSLAAWSASKSRRIITGLVLTLEASIAEEAPSPCRWARTARTCTAMAKRQLARIQTCYT